MCENNSIKIIEEINKLPNEEATELLTNYTNLNLMQILNDEDAFEKYMKELAKSQLKISRHLTGLYNIYAAMKGIENVFVIQDTISDMRKMSKDLEFFVDKWNFAVKNTEEIEQVLTNE